MAQIPDIPVNAQGRELVTAVNDRLRRIKANVQADTVIASLGSSNLLGNGLAIAFGKLVAKVTSGIAFDANGNISVVNGSGIAIDGAGRVSVNPGVGLQIDGSGFLTVRTNTGLTADASGVYIPGGSITNALLAALSVARANIQAGAVGATEIASASITTAHIQSAAITTALIANAAITNALLGSAVVGTANIQNAAITTALIANLAVGNAQINDLAANKITAGTISASVSMTAPNISSTSGSNSVTLTSGALTCLGATAQAQLLSGNMVCTTVGGGVSASYGVSSAGWLDSSGFTRVSCSSSNGIRIGNLGSVYIALDYTSANFTSCPIQINSVTVIDASRNGNFVNLSFSGTGPYTAGTGISIAGSTITNTVAAYNGATGVTIADPLGYASSGIKAAYFSGTSGALTTFTNGIYVYDSAGSYKGMIPLI